MSNVPRSTHTSLNLENQKFKNGRNEHFNPLFTVCQIKLRLQSNFNEFKEVQGNKASDQRKQEHLTGGTLRWPVALCDRPEGLTFIFFLFTERTSRGTRRPTGNFPISGSFNDMLEENQGIAALSGPHNKLTK